MKKVSRRNNHCSQPQGKLIHSDRGTPVTAGTAVKRRCNGDYCQRVSAELQQLYFQDKFVMKTTKEIKQNHLFWFNQGKVLTKLGKLDAALDCFERAIAIKEIYYEAWCEKGYVLEKLGRFAAAENCFNESLGIFCEDSDHIWEDRLDL